MRYALELENVSKAFRSGSGDTVEVLDSTCFEIEPGEFVALVGPSGVGKSTLLAIAGLLLGPDAGVVKVGGRPVDAAGTEAERIRRHELGYVFQSYNLFAYLSAEENVREGLRFSGLKQKEKVRVSDRALEAVGLAHRRSHTPTRMSGGEQQRVAIARALARDPSLILADEPTGNLDSDASTAIVDLLVAATRSAALLLVTHDLSVAKRADRIVSLDGGAD